MKGTPRSPAHERVAGFVRRLGLSDYLGQRLLNARRAWVLGMGPSLKKFDLNALENELVFGVNHAAGVSVRHDLLFIADDRRLVPELRAGSVPIITIDACVNSNPEFFSDTLYYGDIKAVHYGQKIPAILDVTSYPPGLPVAYWTGSVITDLVVPFAVECGISELICLGLDGVDGSFPVTHAWGMDSLTRHLQDTSASQDPEVLPTPGLVAHLQEKAARLAANGGTTVLNATPGGVIEALRRVDPRVIGPVGAWRGATNAMGLDGCFIAIGTSVFALRIPTQGTDATENAAAADAKRTGSVVELSHAIDVSARGTNHHLDGMTCRVEVSFIGEPHISLREHAGDRYLTTRSGFDRFTWRTPVQSFNTTLSSFPRGMARDEAETAAQLFAELAEVADRRATLGEHLATMYLGQPPVPNVETDGGWWRG